MLRYIFAAVIALPAVAVRPEDSFAAPPRPNILLILADDT
jgi:hypothetical protein